MVRIGPRWATRTLISLAFALTLLQTTFPQKGFGQDDDDEIPNDPPGAAIPAPRSLRLGLAKVRRDIRSGEYQSAIESVANIIEEMQGESDYVISSDAQGTQSFRAELSDTISKFPTEAIRLYELQFGAEAKAKSQQALRRNDYHGLGEIIAEFPHTQAALEAGIALGRVEIERGRPRSAQRLLTSVLASSARKSAQEVIATLLLATADAQLGDVSGAEAKVDALRQNPSLAKLLQESKIDPLPKDGVGSWLSKSLGAVSTSKRDLPGAWKVSFGSLTRNLPISENRFSIDVKWRVPTVNEPSGDQMAHKLARTFVQRNHSIAPTLQALVVGPVVLMRTPNKLVAVQFESGKRIWEYVSEKSTADEDTKPVASHDSLEAEIQQRIWDDSAQGQFSSDGKRIFLVEGLPVTGRLQAQRGGFNNWKPEKPIARLVALELESGGKLLWRSNDHSVTDTISFLGAPCPVDGRIYAIGEENDEVQLLCLDPDSGEVHWKQSLCSVEVFQDQQRRFYGATPSFSEGVLVCPTGVGSIVGVDPVTRRILWIHTANGTPNTPNRPNFMRGGNRIRPHKSAGQRWAFANPIIHGTKILLTLPESDKLICLDLFSGRQLWTIPRDSGLFVGGVLGDVAIVVSANRISGIRLEATGEVAWPSIPFTDGVTSGRGLIVGEDYLHPLSNRQLIRIRVSDGEVRERIKLDSPLGNLLICKGHLISQGFDELASFASLTELRERLDSLRASNENKPQIISTELELLSVEGKTSEAMKLVEASLSVRDKDPSLEQLAAAVLVRVLEQSEKIDDHLLERVESSVVDTPMRDRFLRLAVDAYGSSNRWDKSCVSLLKMIDDRIVSSAGQGKSADEPTEFGNDWLVRPSHWIGGRLLVATSRASEHDRDLIRQRSEALAQLVRGHSLNSLEKRFMAIFPGQPAAESLMLSLAETAKANGMKVDAVSILTEALEASDRKIAAAAALALSEIFIKEQNRVGVAHSLDVIERRFSNEEIDSGVLGKDWAAKVRQEPNVSRLVQRHEWNRGKVIVEENQGSPTRGASDDGQIRSQILETVGERFDDLTLFIEKDPPSIRARTPFGELIGEPIPVGREQRSITPGKNANVYRTRILAGRFLVENGAELVAIEPRAELRGESDPAAWRKELIDVTDTPGVQVGPITKSLENPLWGFPITYVTEQTSHLAGRVACVGTRAVAYLKKGRLFCVDAATGELIWERGLGDAMRGADLWGDETRLFVSPANTKFAHVFRSHDGEKLGERDLSHAFEERLVHFGATTIESHSKESDPEKRLTLIDDWTNQAKWTLTAPRGALSYPTRSNEIAFLEESGRLTLRSLLDGSEIFSTNLPTRRSPRRLLVRKQYDRLLVLVGHGADAEQSPEGFRYIQPTSAYPFDNWTVYALDPKTGSMLWPAPAEIPLMGLSPDFPEALPVFLFARQATSKDRVGEPKRPNVFSVLLLDVRDGTVVFNRELGSQIAKFIEVFPGPGSQELTLRASGLGKEYLIKFTSDPVPPAPPVQTANFSAPPGEGAETSRDTRTQQPSDLFDDPEDLDDVEEDGEEDT